VRYEIFDFGDHLGPHPIHAAQDQWRSEAAVARRRRLERHLVDRKRLQPAPQPRQLRMCDAGAGAAGIDQPPIRIVIGEQQSAEPGPRAFGIGPADHEGKSHSDAANGYPAVKGVGKPVLIHGVQVKGNIRKDGRIATSRTLLDAQGKAVTISTRTPLAEAEKEHWAEHDVGYRVSNARLDDIYEHTPEVWLFKPQNIEASLYVWKTGPIARLSKLMAKKFISEEWIMKFAGGGERKMPDALHAGYKFFREAVEAFPFWKDDMKPKPETVFSGYVGTHAHIDLKPDTQVIEEWLAQQLAVSLATDPNSVPMPLKSTGDGWQSMIRLAALEALTEYPDLVRERVVLLLEEPETPTPPPQD
jgi:hypothetical protein